MLDFATYLPSKRVYPLIFRCAIFVVFSALFERKSKLQTKIQLWKASWRPPGFQIWKKQYHSFHWKKKLSIIFFWTKSRFINTKILKPSYFAENTTNMASLKIGAVPHSDERYIAKLQFFILRYTDTRIIFFLWKLWP